MTKRDFSRRNDGMSKKKGKRSARAKEENLFLRYFRFRLPGDAEEVCPPPCKPAELFEKLETSLRLITGKSGFCRTQEERERDKIIGASIAASWLIDWLFSHAFHGDEVAQGQIADLSRKLTQEFVYHARKKSPGIMPRVKRWPEMPGWVSRSSEVHEEMQRLCRELKLGDQFPFPLSAKESAKGKVPSIRSAHHALVDSLQGYIEGYRTQRKRYWSSLDDDPDYYVHPLVLRVANLPPLSPATVKEWIAASREVLEDATDNNPAGHSAFMKGGKYANLGMPPPQSKRAEIVLWKRLAEAWKLRAQAMARLPEDAPPRK